MFKTSKQFSFEFTEDGQSRIMVPALYLREELKPWIDRYVFLYQGLQHQLLATFWFHVVMMVES